jgi:hypothetical protein
LKYFAASSSHMAWPWQRSRSTSIRKLTIAS